MPCWEVHQVSRMRRHSEMRHPFWIIIDIIQRCLNSSKVRPSGTCVWHIFFVNKSPLLSVCNLEKIIR